MLSVKEAKTVLFGQIGQMPAVSMKVADAQGYILAEDVYSALDLPSFDHSAMDGFAVCVENFQEAEQLIDMPLIGEIRAGGKPVEFIEKNTAIGIFTGAPVPKNANCIVIQEKAERKGKRLIFHSSELKPHANIRKRGAQIKAGEKAMSAGMLLNPAAIGWLSALGITSIRVVARPLVSVLATGNELKKPGIPLGAGQIYESNTFALKAALNRDNFRTAAVKSVPDQPKKTYDTIKKMLWSSDVVIISGGISVGKYDLVKDTLFSLGVEQVFYKVAQKPGKPLFAGKYLHSTSPKWVFALPGNPAAALVCFYEYVLPVLKKLSGFSDISLRSAMLPLGDEFVVKGDRELFLRAYATNDVVKILEGQESNMMHSFAASNAIVFLPVSTTPLEKGTLVETHFLP